MSAEAQLRAAIERCGHVGDSVDETAVCLYAAGYSFSDDYRYVEQPPWQASNAAPPGDRNYYVVLSGAYDGKERKIIRIQGQVIGFARGTGKLDDNIVQKILRHLPIVH